MRHDLEAGKKILDKCFLVYGDVPLDKVAFFTTGLTISIELLTYIFGILRVPKLLKVEM